MAQSFLYPSMIAGANMWKEFAPKQSKRNWCIFFTIDFGRQLASGDVLTFTADLDFDGLDITKDGAFLLMQGATSADGLKMGWSYSNPLSTVNGRNFYRRAGAVLDGADRYEISNVVGEGNGMKNGVGIRSAEFGARVDLCGGGSLSMRHFMVELNADGAPHAWAPADGETLAGVGASMSADALEGITPELMGGATQSGIWYETASGDCLRYPLDIPAHGDNQAFNIAATVCGESDGWIDIALEYADAAGHTNRAIERIGFTTEQARRKVAIVVPSGMAVTALYVSKDESQPASRVASIALWQGKLILSGGLELDLGISGDVALNVHAGYR